MNSTTNHDHPPLTAELSPGHPIFERIKAHVEESMRLEKLSNEELAAEALREGWCDILIVAEMMTRLDPLWATRETEVAK